MHYKILDPVDPDPQFYFVSFWFLYIELKLKLTVKKEFLLNESNKL